VQIANFSRDVGENFIFDTKIMREWGLGTLKAGGGVGVREKFTTNDH
jgi:hypothetical protein